MDIIKNKYGLKKENSKGKDQNTYIAKDNQQIKEIWEDISQDAETIHGRIDKYGYPIKSKRLEDGTEIQLRKQSRTGGSTIEVDKNRIKIHNEAGEIGDW